MEYCELESSFQSTKIKDINSNFVLKWRSRKKEEIETKIIIKEFTVFGKMASE